MATGTTKRRDSRRTPAPKATTATAVTTAVTAASAAASAAAAAAKAVAAGGAATAVTTASNASEAAAGAAAAAASTGEAAASSQAASVAGAAAVGMALFLMVELLFQTQLLGGNRTTLGKLLHIAGGFFGGYFFYFLISSDRNYTFIIRFLGILYAYLLLGLVLEWIFTPIEASANFGFIFNDLNSDAQNALLRDFTSFFVASFLFSIFEFILIKLFP